MWVIVIGIAFLVNAIWGAKPLFAVVHEGRHVTEQIAWGVAFGFAIAVPLNLAVLLVPVLSPLRKQMSELVSRIDLSGLNPLWLSLLAGSCEELLFRGALQPIIGLWLTSLLFTIAHARTGRFSSMNWRKAAYAAFVFAGSLFLGWVFLSFGLIAAICTHVTVDVVSLTFARRSSIKSSSPA